jgi:TolB-like protein
VRREAGRVRVTAQLINATTGNHIWAERYDRALESVLPYRTKLLTPWSTRSGGRSVTPNGSA